MKFGITQGRLTDTKRNILQKFPKNWKKEFDYLNKTHLDYIEFFLEKKIKIIKNVKTNEGNYYKYPSFINVIKISKYFNI